jgi:hypothetical protein
VVEVVEVVLALAVLLEDRVAGRVEPEEGVQHRTMRPEPRVRAIRAAPE